MLIKLPLVTLHMRFSDGTEPMCGVRRSARAKQVRLRLLPQGTWELVLPQHMRMTDRTLQDIVQHMTPWAERVWRKRSAEAQQAVLALPEELHIPLTDQRWEVRCMAPGLWPQGLHDAAIQVYLGRMEEGKQCRLYVFEEHTILFLSGATEKLESCCRALQRWLFRRAEILLPSVTHTLAASLGMQVAQIRVRRQRTRWGSCTRDAHISLNFRALLLPEDLLRYLVLHELCHLVHMDHSPAYRAFVARFDPHWKNKEKKLAQAWCQMPPWITV